MVAQLGAAAICSTQVELRGSAPRTRPDTCVLLARALQHGARDPHRGDPRCRASRCQLFPLARGADGVVLRGGAAARPCCRARRARSDRDLQDAHGDHRGRGGRVPRPRRIHANRDRTTARTRMCSTVCRDCSATSNSYAPDVRSASPRADGVDATRRVMTASPTVDYTTRDQPHSPRAEAWRRGRALRRALQRHIQGARRFDRGRRRCSSATRSAKRALFARTPPPKSPRR